MLKKPFSPTTRPLAASALAMFLAVPLCASATTFNISTAVTSAQALSGSDTGTVTSTGSISVPQSAAIMINSGATGSISNSGTIASGANTAWADGIYAGGSWGGSLTNSGVIKSITSTTSGAADAAGVYVMGTWSNLLSNSGSISAQATQSLNGAAYALAVGAQTMKGELTNSGTILASASAISFADAKGVLIGTMNSNLANSGSIRANAVSSTKLASARGISLETEMSGVFTNSGSIEAIANGANAASALGVQVTTMNGTIINDGTISAQASISGTSTAHAAGISLGDMTGTITNNGTISAESSGWYERAFGVRILNTLTGDIINNAGATISASAATTANAIDVWKMVGNITNSGNISSSGSGAAVSVAGGMKGNITNTGTISSSLSDGMRISNGAGLTTASGVHYAINGDITNGGTITAYSTGININGNLVGNITNSGSIISNGRGDGINIDGSMSGSITNTAGAIITATAGTGIAVGALNSGGSVTNSGNINGVFYGINAAMNNAGTIDNMGVITVAGVGIHMVGGNAADTGTIINSGAISTTDGNAIRVDVSAAGYNYVITNTGTITTPTGAYGINIQGLAGTGTLNQNAGTVSGMGVLMGSGDDTVNINGGAIVGTIDGNMELVGGADTINFNATNYVLQGSVNSFEVITFDKGVTDLNGHSFYGGGASTIASGARVIFNGGHTDGNVTNHGILDAGVGTSFISGDYTQTTGSTTRLDIYHSAKDLVGGGPSGNASYLEVGGLATLGNIEAHVSGDDYIANDSSYYVMETNPSGLDTTNMTLSDNSAVLDFSADTTTIQGGIFLTAHRVASYQSLAGNNYGLAGQLDAIGASGVYTPEQQALLGALDASPTASALAQKLADMSPDATGAALEGSRTITGQVGTMVFGRLTQLASAGKGSGMAAGDGSLNNGVWVQGFASSATQDGSTGNNGYDATNSGFALGADMAIGSNMRAGLSLASTKSDIDIAGGAVADTLAIESSHVTVYGSYDAGKWNVAGMIASTSHDYDSVRNAVNKASYGGSQLTLMVEGAMPMAMGGMTVTPLVSLRHATLDLDGYTESGAGALTVASSSYDSNELGLGARVAKDIKGGSLTWVPRASLRYRHEMGDVQQESSATLTSAGISFNTASIERSRGTMELGLGVDMLSGDRITVSADYQLDSRSDYSANTARLNLRYKF